MSKVGVAIWEFSDAADRDGTGTANGLRAGDLGFIRGQSLFTASTAGGGSSTWAAAIPASLDWKASVRAATAAGLPANTRTGNVLTADANGALPSIDAVALAVGESVLVQDEALGENNGPYEVTDLGSGGTKWVLTRRGDADTSDEVTNGLTCYVSEGTANGGKRAVLVTTDPIVLNTTALVFDVQASATQDLSTTMVAGNTTPGGGVNLVVSSGDSIVSAAGTDLTLAPAAGRDVIVTTDLSVAGTNDLTTDGFQNTGTPLTDVTNKLFKINTRPYTNANGVWRWLTAQALITSNVVQLGGSTADDSATLLEFYTATAVNSLGVLRGRISNAGAWRIGADGISVFHEVFGDGFVVRDTDTTATNKNFQIFSNPYTTAQGSWLFLASSADITNNILRLGGHTAGDSSTLIEFYTATGLNAAGVLRGSFDSAGQFRALNQIYIGGATLNLSSLTVLGTDGQIIVSTNETNLTDKISSWGTNHYTNVEEPMMGMRLQSGSGFNAVIIGGGSAAFNAATQIRFYTGATATTQTGTERGSFDAAGDFNVLNQLLVAGAAATDGAAGVNNLVIGAGDAAYGMTIFTGGSSVGQINFADTSGGSQGALGYNHSQSQMIVVVTGGTAYRFNNINFTPGTDGVQGLGASAGLAWNSLVLDERADHVGVPTATHAEIWLLNTATQSLMFTDDAGSDWQIGGDTQTVNTLLNAETGTPPTTVAGDGAWWTQDDAPTSGMFTDDDGNDRNVSRMVPITLSAQEAMLPASGGPAPGAINDVDYLEYTNVGGASQFSNWQVTMPWTYGGQGIVVRVYWHFPTDVPATSVVWQAAFERHVSGLDVATSSFAATQVTIIDPAATTNAIVITDIAFTAAQIDGVVAGDSFRLRVYRDPGHGSDNFTNDVRLNKVILLET